MSKRLRNVLLLIVVTTFIIWGINRYYIAFLPEGSNHILAIFLYVLGLFTALRGALDAGKYVSELLFPDPPGPSKKETLRKEMRETHIRVKSDHAEEFAKEMLGDERCPQFWEQIHSNRKNAGTLNELVSDPFSLDGLIEVFEQSNDQLPRNIGALLEKLINVQWTQEKLGKKNWVDLKQIQFAFAQLASSHYPSKEYPAQSFYREIHGEEAAYSELLDILGTKTVWGEPLGWWGKSQLKIYSRLADASDRAQRVPSFLRWFVLLPITILYYIISTPYWISDRIEKLLKIRRNRAESVLRLAEQAHIIKRDGKAFQFTPGVWSDYFAALNNSRYPVDTIIEGAKTGWHSSYWNRLDPGKDSISTTLCGLIPNPSVYIEKLILVDPYLAAQCIVSGIDNISEEIRYATYNRLIANMLDVRSGGEERSADSAKLLRELRDDPSCIDEILETIEKNYVEDVNLELVKIIAEYGTNAVELLIKKLDAAQTSKRYIILALGEIGDQRALPILMSLLTVNDRDLRLIVMMVVAFQFRVSTVNALWRDTLLFQYDHDDGKTLWSHAQIVGPAIVPALIDLFRYGVRKFSHKNGKPLRTPNWDDAPFRFCSLLTQHRQNSSTKKSLLDAFIDSSNKHFKIVMINALAEIQCSEANDMFIALLTNTDAEIQMAVIQALGAIKSTDAVPVLIGKLYSDNVFIVSKAVSALGSIGSSAAVQSLIKKLESNETARYEAFPSEQGTPIDYLAMCALSQIQNETAQTAAIKWCGAHLSDQRNANWGRESVSRKCVDYLYMKSHIPLAAQLYEEWTRKNGAP
jgi:hypothetical protein